MDLTKTQYVSEVYNYFILTHKQNKFPLDSTLKKEYKDWAEEVYNAYGETTQPYDAFMLVLKS